MLDGMAPPTKHPLAPGQRVARWTVLDPSDRTAVVVQCECGTVKTVRASNLVGEHIAVQSCGCLRVDRNVQRTTHGVGYEDYRYRLWKTLMAKCYRSSHQDFAYYGGRGIEVHRPWHDAATFVREIIELLGERPDAHTLDRIDNDGNYEPRNVRWATRAEQANNRRHRSR